MINLFQPCIFLLSLLPLTMYSVTDEQVPQNPNQPVVDLVTDKQDSEDPVQFVLKEYEHAVDEFRTRKNPSAEERKALRQEWMRRISNVVDQYPDSIYIKTARLALLGLSNGLGEFAQSETILSKIIDESDDPREKICMYNELGEVARIEYWADSSPSKAESAIEAFDKSYSLFRSLPNSSKDPELGGREVVALCMLGEMLSNLDKSSDSATRYRSARKLLLSSQEITIEAQLKNYDLEAIAVLEMIEWIKAKKEKNAIQCLDILSKLNSYRNPPSHYALQYANLQYEQSPMEFQKFVSKWLDDHMPDEHTPVLATHLAFSYYNDGLFEKALPIFEDLRNKHVGDFQKLEKEAFLEGKGGYYEEILSELAIIYLRQGKIEEAEKVRNDLKKLLPKSQVSESLTPENFSADLASFPEEHIQKANYMRRIVLIIIGLIFISLGIYFHQYKRRPGENK